ncbi:ATP-binding protein [Streptomyces sp. NPDC008001]|uniref:ATP-binding protein n=1 Tax=Streptomyces sp. NPDC008001 TaxID=3364804 RepID=UPI0036E8AAD5
MGYAIKHPKGKVAPERAPLLVRPRRFLSRAVDSAGRAERALRVRLAARGRVAPAQRWRMRRSPLQLLSYVAVPVLLAWVGFAVFALVAGETSPVTKWCSARGDACSVVFGFLNPFLSLGLATLAFLVLTYGSVRRSMNRAARKDPRSVVPTAGPVVAGVVGRMEMCLVIARGLRDRRTRRPYLLVGGVGAGKTSVLVQLTQMLARRGAVPVPVRLRDVDLDGARLDFRDAAMKRFSEMADRDVISARHSERVWRQLCMDDKAVVLADGLEETYADGGDQKERDVLIRRAIERAEEQKLPLVIASRPHAPLEHTRAAVIDLEPLSEEAALEYLEDGHPDLDDHRMDWIVETAAVAESPLYLQIARQLRDHHLLEHLSGAKRWTELDTRSADRTGLQRRLLDAWRDALIAGRIHDEIALDPCQREKVVEVISALAGIGLLQDQLEVRLSDLLGGTGMAEEVLERLFERLGEDCREETDALRRHALLSLCATQGEQLGLVETRGERVRFQHSILQAYLGSGYLAINEHGALARALEEPGPGRELLIGLTLNSRSEDAGPQQPVAHLLTEAAKQRKDAKALDMYAAALEIDRVAGAAEHLRIAETLFRRWSAVTAGDRRTIESAKQRLVHRFGEVLRAIGAAESEHDPAHGGCPAYEWFFKIATVEPSYPIQLAIAQEIGAGGDRAFDVLRTMFPLPKKGEPGRDDPWVQYESAMREQAHAEHRKREIFVRLRPDDEETHVQFRKQLDEACEQRLRIWRRFVMRAWLVPMMVGSVSEMHREQAKERLALWLAHLEPQHARSHGADLPLSLEIALAQGFKSAANRRQRHPHTDEKAREFLVTQAETMLAHARYWYTQMTLIHALCLWELPDRMERAPQDGSGTAHPAKKTDPTQAVERWLSLAGSKQDSRAQYPGDRTAKGDRLHPFVAEAANLAVLALESGRPERFIWIDEIGAVNKIGSSPAHSGAYRKHSLWIPPSVGWSTLHPRAQQLLGDVFLLRNLTERDGEQPAELEARLERADRTVLPPCFTGDRRPFRPRRTVGTAGNAPPGSTCLRDCPFELCPYPAMGSQPRAELRETFCRQQQALLRRYRRSSFLNPFSWRGRKGASWHGMTPGELRKFWEEMADRSRTPSD